MYERDAPAPDSARTRLRVWASVVSVGLFLLLAGSASAAVVPVTTTGSMPANFRFSPAVVAITAGDTVSWTNAGGSHNVHFTGEMLGTPATPAGPGAMWPVTRVFSTPGTFTYFCDPHQASGMTGTVTVLAAAPPQPPGGGGGTPGGDSGGGGGGAPGGDSKIDLGKLQLKISDATPSRRDTRVRFYGSVRPAITGRVLIQRRSRNGSFKTVAKAALKADGNVSTYSKSLRAQAGLYRAEIRENADHNGATSRPKRIR